MLYESLVLFSEVVLSAYPILIKKVAASTFLQTGIRMATFSGLAGLAALVTGTPLSGLSLKEVLATGLMNLIHVGSSYYAFDALAAGNAMSLFYTYPVWNMLGASLLFKEKIPMRTVPWIGLAIVGMLLLSQPSATNWSMTGVVAALLAALTETGIYLYFRSTTTKEDSEPWTGMFKLYGGSLVLWLPLAAVVFLLGSGGVFGTSGLLGTTARGLKTMLLFNTLVGFVGYALRFFMIPKVSTVAFSAMSFFGVIAAYLLGWLFVDEVPNTVQMLGAAAIIVANTVLVTKETA
jgi:drug/metabolite transporter (DMT)-like permease